MSLETRIIFNDQARESRIEPLDYIIVEPPYMCLGELVRSSRFRLFDLDPGQIDIPEELEYEFPSYDKQVAVNFFERIIKYDLSLTKHPRLADYFVRTAEIWSNNTEGYEYFLPNTADLLYGLSEFYKTQRPVNKLPFILAETNFNAVTSSEHPDGDTVVEFVRNAHKVNKIVISTMDTSTRNDNLIGFPFVRAV